MESVVRRSDAQHFECESTNELVALLFSLDMISSKSGSHVD